MLTFQDIITNLQKYWTKRLFTSTALTIWKWEAEPFNPFIALKTLGETMENVFCSRL